MVIKDLLFQLLVIIVPALLYFSLIDKKFQVTNRFKKVYFLLTSILSIIICISFPVNWGDIHFDFRLIPWILSFLYGGNIVGIVTTVTSVLYRIGLYGVGFLPFLILYIVMTILVVVTLPNKNSTTEHKTKYAIVVLFTYLLLINSIGLIFVDDFIDSKADLIFQISLIVIYTLATWLIIPIYDFMEKYGEWQEQLQKSEKIRVVGQLAASVAHEIRNPITTVMGFLQLLSQESFVPKEKKKFFDLSIKELKRANSIISDYLSLAKPHESEQQLDVNKEIEYVKNVISSYATIHNASIKFFPEEYVPLVKGNRERFHQAIINILKNAVEVVNTDGTGKVMIFTKEKDGQVIIHIKDNGIGMSPDKVKRLGTPFFSTKEKGTGLGLMVCYNVVHHMNGEIKVKSKKGEGSCFTIILKGIR